MSEKDASSVANEMEMPMVKQEEEEKEEAGEREKMHK